MQPDQANFLLNGVYLPALRNEHRITKTVIEAIPQDRGDYRPDLISKSALDLAWHIVVTEMRFMEALTAGEFRIVALYFRFGRSDAATSRSTVCASNPSSLGS